MKNFFVIVGSFFFCFPITAVFLYINTAPFNYYNFLALVAAIAAEHCILLSSAQVQRYRGLIDLNNWLSNFPDVEFIKRSTEDYNLDNEVNDLLSRGFGLNRSQKLGSSIEIFQVICPVPPLPGGIKAFAFGTTCIIFVRDPPGNETEYGKFKIHHELGHAFPVTPAFLAIEYNTLMSLPFLIFIALSLAQSWILTSVAVSVYTVSRLFFFYGGGSYKMAELSADQFAAYFLCKTIDLDHVANLLRRSEKKTLLTKKRVTRLKAFASGDTKCESPDLPEIPLTASIIPCFSIVLLSIISNPQVPLMVIEQMFGVALAFYFLFRLLARKNNKFEFQITRYIVFRNQEVIAKMRKI